MAPTQIDENEHDGPHVSSESQVVITTDTCPIDSRALGVGWVAWFGFPCYGPALRVGRTKNKSRGRARAIATTGVLCSPALGESDTYPAVSGGAGGAENRNAPNGTAALSFVANSEAARYVFVVVAAADVMIAGRRYDTFVLACHRPVDEETKVELPLREAPCSLSICLDLDHELLALLSSEHSREASLSCLTTSLAANSDSSRPYCNGTFQCRSNNERANSRYRSSDGSGRGSRSSGCLVVVVVSLFVLLGRCVAQRSTGRR